MAKDKKKSVAVKSAKKSSPKAPAKKASGKVAPAGKAKVAAKPVMGAKSDKKVDKLKKDASKSAKVESKAAAKKVEKLSSTAAVKVLKAEKTDKKAKKSSAPKEEIDAEEPILEDNFGPDELAEYADEVEAATRDEDDAEGSEASEAPVGATAAPADSMVSNGESDDEIVLTDAEGRKYCRVKDCDQLAMVEGYCRYHYLLLWKKIQVRKKILTEGKLERYVEDLTARYPDKYLEMLRKDLKTEKDFVAAIQELELDDSGMDNEFEDDTQYLDEVRGMAATTESARDEEEF